jgi:hypothetical protein
MSAAKHMKQYIVQRSDGLFLSFDKCGWCAEYPDAKVFENLQSARRAVDQLTDCGGQVGIYETEDYAAGNGPTVRS